MTIVVEKPKIADYKRHLLVCTGPRCTQDGAAQALFDSLGDKFKAAGLAEGESIAALALHHKLPADYIEAVLTAPVEADAQTADISETAES